MSHCRYLLDENINPRLKKALLRQLSENEGCQNELITLIDSVVSPINSE